MVFRVCRKTLHNLPKTCFAIVLSRAVLYLKKNRFVTNTRTLIGRRCFCKNIISLLFSNLQLEIPATTKSIVWKPRCCINNLKLNPCTEANIKIAKQLYYNDYGKLHSAYSTWSGHPVSGSNLMFSICLVRCLVEIVCIDILGISVWCNCPFETSGISLQS